MALDPQLAIQLLERRRLADEERRLAPARAFAGGFTTGLNNNVQQKQLEAQEKKKKSRDFIEKLLTSSNFEITKNTQDANGNVVEAPIGMEDIKLITDYYEQNKDLPPANVYNFKRVQKENGLANQTSRVSWETATPTQQKAAQALIRGDIRTSDLGLRDRGIITVLANEYAAMNSIPFKSYEGDVKKGMASNLATGKLGLNALSLNTALGHANDALTAYESMGNTDVNLINKPLNWLRKNTNDPNVIALGINLNALRGELATVFKGTAGTDQEIAQWKEYLTEDLTPTQFYAAIPKVQELLNSRLDALEYQQENVMDNKIGDRKLISPKSKKIMERLKSPDKTTQQNNTAKPDNYGYSKGETKVIGGKTYTYMGNNQWR